MSSQQHRPASAGDSQPAAAAVPHPHAGHPAHGQPAPTPQVHQAPQTGGAEMVQLRNGFYRDGYRKLFGISGIIGIALLLSLGVNALQFVMRPSPKYFATTTSGALIPLSPLDQPNMNRQTVENWSAEAIVNSYSFDFTNFRSQLQSAGNKYFTAAGFKAFVMELKNNGNLGRIRKDRLVVHTVLTGAPILIGQGSLNGRYAWKLRAPVLVSYEGSQQVDTQKAMVTLLVVRASTLEHDKGVAIEQFVLNSGGK